MQFCDSYKNVDKTGVLYIFKIVSVLTFLKIVLLIVPINCKNFANLNSTCTRINYKIVPVTDLNKYLQYGTSGTE